VTVFFINCRLVKLPKAQDSLFRAWPRSAGLLDVSGELSDGRRTGAPLRVNLGMRI
jgi:hypothetical protein